VKQRAMQELVDKNPIMVTVLKPGYRLRKRRCHRQASLQRRPPLEGCGTGTNRPER
jgi:hypothetical protein